jgi:hypothetical protein
MKEKYNDLDIENYNSKDELHGYQERYNRYGRLLVRGNSKNNKDIGYNEWHHSERTDYFIL